MRRIGRTRGITGHKLSSLENVVEKLFHAKDGVPACSDSRLQEWAGKSRLPESSLCAYSLVDSVVTYIYIYMFHMYRSLLDLCSQAGWEVVIA